VPACILVSVVFLFHILYVTNQALWLQDFNKLTNGRHLKTDFK